MFTHAIPKSTRVKRKSAHLSHPSPSPPTYVPHPASRDAFCCRIISSDGRIFVFSNKYRPTYRDHSTNTYHGPLKSHHKVPHPLPHLLRRVITYINNPCTRSENPNTLPFFSQQIFFFLSSYILYAEVLGKNLVYSLIRVLYKAGHVYFTLAPVIEKPTNCVSTMERLLSY